jgi:hypothetical protein
MNRALGRGPLVALTYFCFGVCVAAESGPTKIMSDAHMSADQQAVATAVATAAIQTAAVEKANAELLGFKWGMGIAVSVDAQSGTPVKSASVVSGVVRVDEESPIVPRIFLETHKFFALKERDAIARSGATLLKLDDQPVRVATWGHGPFVGLQSSGENVVDAFAAGYMIGWRRKADTDDDNSFNMGIGAVVDFKATVLGDGVTADQPVPSGETTVRLKTEPRLGVTLVYSFSF